MNRNDELKQELLTRTPQTFVETSEREGRTRSVSFVNLTGDKTVRDNHAPVFKLPATNSSHLDEKSQMQEDF
jgi:hypothetical protein